MKTLVTTRAEQSPPLKSRRSSRVLFAELILTLAMLGAIAPPVTVRSAECRGWLADHRCWLRRTRAD
jgi:hypothetical protein